MIYLVPECRTESAEILNVVNTKQKPIGYIAYLFCADQSLYVFGSLQEKGEEQNFIDIVRHYIKGLQGALGIEDNTNIHIEVCGDVISLDDDESEEDDQGEQNG